jgi:hypothetical protein
MGLITEVVGLSGSCFFYRVAAVELYVFYAQSHEIGHAVMMSSKGLRDSGVGAPLLPLSSAGKIRRIDMEYIVTMSIVYTGMPLVARYNLRHLNVKAGFKPRGAYGLSVKLANGK